MKAKILRMLRNYEGYLSGQEICNQIGVSRTAVWKVINQLKEDGYGIEAIPKKGYRILKYPDFVTSEEITSLLTADSIIKEVKFYEETDSTNTRAKKLAEDGAVFGTLVIAEQQNHGKGRRGETWVSPKGKDIWMSLIIKPLIEPEKASMLTLVAALSVWEGITKVTGLKAFIKWPNDIVLNGKKVCGILTEMSSELDYINYVVIGIGINGNMEAVPEPIKEIATSLYIEGGRKIKRSNLIVEIMECFQENYNRFFKTKNLEFILKRYNEVLINCGKEVKIIEESAEYTGVALGINKAGALCVQLPDGTEKEIFSGEVSVRGLYEYV